MKRLLLVFIALGLLASCSDDRLTASRPKPPHFVDSGNKPSQEVALNFVKKFSSQVQAAIDRTPYDVKDIDKQMKIAQQLYREDGSHLIQWVDEGERLFKAAHIQVCDLYLHAMFATWKEAYPLNGPISKQDMDRKLEMAAYAREKGQFCQNHIHMHLHQ